MTWNRIFTKLVSSAALISLVVLLGFAARTDACYTVVVGKNAAADGHVIMAHNEDDDAPQIVNHYKVARQQHAPGDRVDLLNGGTTEQVPETWAYLWSQMPGMKFSDSYLNEWGVCVASDRCDSQENQPELSEGGIGYMLRRLVAERAKTAREGVRVAAGLIERYGYEASGRTYIISDPNEGWLLCAVGGRHWLAQRVPDDEVAIIANTFTVHQIDLADTNRFLASADIVDYASARGWYDPRANRTFDFAVAYADPETAADSSNFCRQWSGLNRISRDPVALSPNLLFSVVPGQKLDVTAVMAMMRDHYDGTALYRAAEATGSPHQREINTICNEATQTSFVAELRGDLPLDVGIAYWVSLASPCASCYIPFYFGTADFPAGYADMADPPSEDLYRQKTTAPLPADSGKAFWAFSGFHHRLAGDYARQITTARTAMEGVERNALTQRESVEKAALELYTRDNEAARTALYNYSSGVYQSAVDAMAGKP